MRTVAILSVLALAACSSGGGGNSATGAGVSGSNSGGASSGLNMVDACAALPGDTVSQAIGQPLKSAELKDVMTDSGSGMMGSSCVYDFGDARLVILQLNRFPNGADMASTFDQTRGMSSKGGSTPVEDVPGLGQRAFWAPGSGNLFVMLDDNRQVSLSLTRLPTLADAKGKVIALAHRVVG